jgi:hypothetical protein
VPARWAAVVVFVMSLTAAVSAQENLRTAPSAAAKSDAWRNLTEKLRPIHERLTDDDRVRIAEGVVAAGVVAYELRRPRRPSPLIFVGGTALRFGLHRQLAAIREQSGFSAEPSIGFRRITMIFRKTFD